MSSRRKQKDQSKAKSFSRKLKQGSYIRSAKIPAADLSKPDPAKEDVVSCAFNEEVICIHDYDCDKCENLPLEKLDLYRGALKKKKASRQKVLDQTRSKRTEIRCSECGKLIGYVYEKIGPIIKDGGFYGKDELAYCRLHKPGDE